MSIYFDKRNSIRTEEEKNTETRKENKSSIKNRKYAMTDNIDDDEALFDDIYDDDSKSEVPKTSEKKNEEDKNIGGNQATNENKTAEQKTGNIPDTSANGTLSNNSNSVEPNSGKPSETPVAQSVPHADEPSAQPQVQVQTQPQTQVAQPQMQGTQPHAQPQQMPGSLPSQQQQFMQSNFQQQQQQQQPMGEQQVPTGYNSRGEPIFHDKVKAELEGKEEGKMFIGGLTWETDEESLGNYFGQFGVVTELHIMRDTATGRSRGFAFLTFKDSKSVDEVLKQKHVLDGKLIDPKRAIPREEQDKTGKIFVGGIAPDVTHEEFTDYFKQFGDIIDSQLMIDKDTGKSRGYGFVTYDSAEAVARVTQNKYVMFHGRQMEIKKAEPRNQQRKSGHNNFGGYGNAPGSGYAPVQGQQMVNPYMQMAGGYYNQGNMAQYWQQMQQMQQYWMRMQQMQQAGAGGAGSAAGAGSGGPAATNMAPGQMQMPSMAAPGSQSGSPAPEASDGQGRESSSSNEARNDEDDVPNPQERPQPRLPSGPRNFRSGNRRRGGRGGSHHHSGGGRGRNAGGYHPYRR